MPKRYTNKKKGAILYQYGSKFLHKLLDIESFLVKHTDLTRNRLYIMGGCCLTITGMIRSLFRGKAFTPIAWIIISFYAPIEDKILKKIDAMRVGALYSGTILRFLPPTEERKHPYMIVKTDSGVEVLCTLPNWKKPPMEMDSVNVKIVEIRPNGQNTLVLGFIKR